MLHLLLLRGRHRLVLLDKLVVDRRHRHEQREVVARQSVPNVAGIKRVGKLALSSGVQRTAEYIHNTCAHPQSEEQR